MQNLKESFVLFSQKTFITFLLNDWMKSECKEFHSIVILLNHIKMSQGHIMSIKMSHYLLYTYITQKRIDIIRCVFYRASIRQHPGNLRIWMEAMQYNYKLSIITLSLGMFYHSIVILSHPYRNDRSPIFNLRYFL